MAAKLGYEAIKYLVKKNMMKRGAGITTIPGKSQKLAVGANTDALHKLMKAKGIDTAKVSVKDVEKFVNIQNAINKKLKTKVISQGHPEFQGITEKLLGKKAKVHPFQGMAPTIQQDVDGIIKNLKSMEPMDAMKEANLIIGRKGKYKNLSIDESQRILKETDDHIFERDIKPDPEDFESGGRVAFKHGTHPLGWNDLIDYMIEQGFITEEEARPLPGEHSTGKPEPTLHASGGRIGFAEGKTYKDWLNYRLKEIAKRRLPTPFKEWKKGDIKMASGGIAGQLHLHRPGYSGGALVKLLNLLKGKKKNVWRGSESRDAYKNILRGDWYPEEFSGRFFTPDKDLAKWYAMRQGTLTGKVKKLKLTEKEIKEAQEFAEKNLDMKYADDLLVSEELAKKATVDLPATALAKIEAVIRKAKRTKKAK